ncbi:hypothetical protein HU200_027562 [Digitaria exilis]|uniref:Protein kinase domain-containing protein n=1 Tax=Digitaria exilis TaxID=1010633 RepID=A0A835BY82_9POAL|nr:hypothetical protein HU200_027562 [Digitaria exilis]
MMPNTSWFCILLVVCVSDAAGFDTKTEFIYNGFAGSNLQLDGSAYITQEGILSLTTASSDITGHGFHPNPMFVEFQGMYANPSFSTTFVFSIAPDYSSRTGEGMAFVISPAADFAAAMPGGYLGLHNYRGNTFLAIELDTVANQEFKDIDDKHVGIDLNNLVSITSCSAGYSYQDNTDNIIQLTFEELRLSSGDPMQVWVDYDGGSMNLNVTLALVPMYKPSPPLLSYTVNLSTFLPQAYVGFSASTGDKRVAAHQILGWSFKLNGLAPPLNYSLLPLKREYQIQDAEKKKLIKWLPATISSLAMVTGLTACFLLRCWCNRRRENQEDWESELGPRRFSYKILRAATNGFSSRHLLGKGGFGRVYAGVLDPSGLRIAVKRISSESSQGLAQFTAEILILGRLRHRNLVRCSVWSALPPRGLGAGDHPPRREGEQRVARCRDERATGHFGLARLHDHCVDAHTTHVAGTMGYLAPELTRFGKATKATDVFAFRAFILEVACGRRPVGLNARGELLVLVEWVREVWEASGCIADAMDPRLEDYPATEADLVLKLGLLCSHPLPAARPGIRLVTQYLDGDMPLPAGISPDYFAITDVDDVFEMAPSLATTVTSLSGGR